MARVWSSLWSVLFSLSPVVDISISKSSSILPKFNQEEENKGVGDQIKECVCARVEEGESKGAGRKAKREKAQ